MANKNNMTSLLKSHFPVIYLKRKSCLQIVLIPTVMTVQILAGPNVIPILSYVISSGYNIPILAKKISVFYGDTLLNLSCLNAN